MLFKIALAGALSALSVVGVTSQSCVMLINDTTTSLSLTSDPCDEAALEFTLEGVTLVAENTVNLAIVLDGSGSISTDDFLTQQNFSSSIVAAFADDGLFDNGGNASYVQFASDLVSSGTFSSEEDFNAFAAADVQARGGTNTAAGIDEATALLTVTNTSAAFMIVITDGESNVGDLPEDSADIARANGITVLAVGVGPSVNFEELVGIGGNESNVFSVTDFDSLDAALSDVIAASGGSSIPCPSTGVNLTIEFNESVSIVAADPGLIDGTLVTINAADLEDNPTKFDLILDVCDLAVGDFIILSLNFTDDQGNDPDLSDLMNIQIGADFTLPLTPSPTEATVTPSPTDVPTPSPTDLPPTDAPTSSPSVAPTSSPSDAPTLSPTDGPTPSPSAFFIPTMPPTSSPTSVGSVSPTSSSMIIFT